MKRTKRFLPVKIKVLGWGDISTLKEALSLKQQGICPVCRKELNAPCLDHHHKKRIKGSGLIRGVLCRSCNVMLGKIENNSIRYSISQEDLPAVLRNMALYIEQPHLPYIHPDDAPKTPILKKSSYNKLKSLYDGKAAFPPYRIDKKGQNVQKLTKPLEALYKKYQLAPEFYS